MARNSAALNPQQKRYRASCRKVTQSLRISTPLKRPSPLALVRVQLKCDGTQ